MSHPALHNFNARTRLGSFSRLVVSSTLSAFVLLASLAWTLPAAAQRPADTNYDEAKVGAYTLPELLRCADGSEVKDAATWQNKRRPEILKLFEQHMFGRTPGGKLPETRYEVTSTKNDAVGGRAVRKEVTIHFTSRSDGPKLGLLVYLPKHVDRAPAFAGLNFSGNHAVDPDPSIALNPGWFRNAPDKGYVDNRATDKSRGAESSRWDVEAIVKRGYALVTACYTDIDPDFDDGFKNGVHPLFYKPGQTRPEVNEWGSIGAWAWGLSRMLDYLETEPTVDAKRVAVMGHSRLGKTSLWAGAQDERFALVISNNSGEGGAAISRRDFGETVAVLNRAFPHWFCDNYNQYSLIVSLLPVDAHMLVALCAPRPVYIASAVEDQWADPRGEFLAGYYAQPVYQLLGKPGLGVTSDATPAIDHPLATGSIGYHLRTGKHDVTPYDWAQYLNFADLHFRTK